MMTKPEPVSIGSARSSCVTASSPPADAPMPTIGNGTPVSAGASSPPRPRSTLEAACASSNDDDPRAMDRGSDASGWSETRLAMQTFCALSYVLDAAQRCRTSNRSRLGFEGNQYHKFGASRLRVDRNRDLQLLQEGSHEPHAEAFRLGPNVKFLLSHFVLPMRSANGRPLRADPPAAVSARLGESSTPVEFAAPPRTGIQCQTKLQPRCGG